MKRALLIVLLVAASASFAAATPWDHVLDLMELGGIDAAAELAADNTVVLFFHATWCPTCNKILGEIVDRDADFPDDLVVVVVDYDDNRELKRRYRVTYQHTFVVIDENGERTLTWNGGGYDALLSRTGKS